MRTAVSLMLLPALVLVTMGADAAPRAKKKRKAVPATTPAPAPAEPTPEPEPEPEPAPAPAPTAAPATPAAEPRGGNGAASVDVDSLRQEYLALRDELFKSRARASTVASQLYSTRIELKLTYTTARFYSPGKATIRLDGATVYEDATGAIGGDDAVRFFGYVAPGRHVITFRVEATGKDDDSFTSTTESQVVVKAVPGKDLLVHARARDSGNIAYEWKRSERGSYGLGLDVAVKSVPREAGKASK
jgi:hypothetical protein